jgi:hypothetical protein
VDCSFGIGRLYSLALLNTLNMRKGFRKEAAGPTQYTFRSGTQVKETASYPGHAIALDKISVSHERSQQVEIGADEKLPSDKRYEVDERSV